MTDIGLLVVSIVCGIAIVMWRTEAKRVRALRSTTNELGRDVTFARQEMSSELARRIDAERRAAAAIRALRKHCPPEALVEALDPEDVEIG